MSDRGKRFLVMLVVFGAGLGIGTAGGYVLNDITSREDPNAIQEIRQEMEQQQRLDDYFAGQQGQSASDEGSNDEATPAEGSNP